VKNNSSIISQVIQMVKVRRAIVCHESESQQDVWLSDGKGFSLPFHAVRTRVDTGFMSQ